MSRRPVSHLLLCSFSLANIIKFSFSSLASDKDLKDVEAFFADKSTNKVRSAGPRTLGTEADYCSQFAMALSQGLDSVRANARWQQRDAADVEDWLRAQGYLK